MTPDNAQPPVTAQELRSIAGTLPRSFDAQLIYRVADQLEQHEREMAELRELLLGSLGAARPFVKHALWGHKSPLASEDYVWLAKHCEAIDAALAARKVEASKEEE